MRVSSRRRMNRWATVAFALFLLTPFVHLHTKAPATDELSFSTRLSSLASCSICSYHSNVVVAIPETESESLAVQLISIPALVLEWSSAPASPLSSRAPPAPLT